MRIGSFFESPVVNIVGARTVAPWAYDSDVSYVQTGRQALAAISRMYQQQGRKQLLVPDYLCGSMLQGFDESHWDMKTYRIDETLGIDLCDLLGKIENPSSTVILSATYFGNEPTEKYVSEIKRLRSLGVRVIEDETHRVLGTLEMVGDIGFASLRKVLPVADGAYIRGAFSLDPELECVHHGWQAMDEKLAGNVEASNKMYRESNIELQRQIFPPSLPSKRTIETLSEFDYEELRCRRRNNAGALRSYLADIKKVETLIFADVPSHLVVRVSDAKQIQSLLARKGIFCPIHWPQPERLKNTPWRNDLLSLPIDHRYTPHDMRRMAREIELIVEISECRK